jgi:N-acetylmuramoyl-L-alanine amidase
MIKVSWTAGHGLNTSGKQTPDGYKEWSINNKIVRYAMDVLSKYEEVAQLRVDDSTGTRDIPLKERTDRINGWGATAHIDVHANAFGNGWSAPNGVETYVYKTNPAEANNLARNVHDRIIHATGATNRGVKAADFHMLRETKMTSILVESGFMTNQAEADKLKTDDYCSKIGKAIAEGVAAHYGLKIKYVEPPKTDDSKYDIVIGWFNGSDVDSAFNKIKATFPQWYMEKRKK